MFILVNFCRSLNPPFVVKTKVAGADWEYRAQCGPHLVVSGAEELKMMYPETELPAPGTPKVLKTLPVKSNLTRAGWAGVWLARGKARRKTIAAPRDALDILLGLFMALSFCLRVRVVAMSVLACRS